MRGNRTLNEWNVNQKGLHSVESDVKYVCVPKWNEPKTECALKTNLTRNAKRTRPRIPWEGNTSNYLKWRKTFENIQYWHYTNTVNSWGPFNFLCFGASSSLLLALVLAKHVLILNHLNQTSIEFKFKTRFPHVFVKQGSFWNQDNLELTDGWLLHSGFFGMSRNAPLKKRLQAFEPHSIVTVFTVF